MAKYKFHNTIGGGGFGVVRKATRVKDGWQCVAKFLKEDYTEKELLRFKREVRIQTQLNHPNIVPIMGMKLSADPPWFIMPRALFNLRQFLQSGYGEENLWVFEEVANGIEYAHNNGVIHRDIKPENILIFNDNEDIYSAVSDFGLGCRIERDTPTITSSNIPMGTVQYSAPEQLEDAKNAQIPADIYSLGKLLFEILTGKIPFPNINYDILAGKFKYIVQKATDNKPDKRYQSVSKLLNDFQLVTSNSQLFDKSIERIQNIIKDILNNLNSKSIEKLARVLYENADDEQMLIQVFPRMPDSILMELIKNHLDSFNIVFKKYDIQLDDYYLAFEYCDVAADFYEKVFNFTQDYEIKEVILRGLPFIGYNNNRWHVGSVYARIVFSLEDESLIMVVYNIFKENPNIADWHKEYFKEKDIPELIRQVLN